MTLPVFDPTRPYDQLPLLPPAGDLESRTVLKACIEARASLAALKEATALIPNPAILINTVPMLEARASSEIENIVTTADRLFQLAQSESGAGDPATKEALRYQTALLGGVALLERRPLSTGTAVEVARALLGIDVDIRKVPGTALHNQATGAVVYTPPHGQEHLRSLLANWERFLHDERSIDPLIRMAVGHYQFEAIHPFIDGNGRTGRILNLLFLVEQGLLDVPVLYLSRAIIRQRSAYYRLLNAVTARDEWEPWLLYMLEAVNDTAVWTMDKIKAMRALMDAAAVHLKANAPGLYSRELIDVIFVQPYSRIGNVVSAGIAKRQTASVYLKQLCEIGMLHEIKAGREKLFLHPNLLELLTAEDHHVPPYARV